ncbi:hypothetical protein [Streptomyces sp. 1222.5]
MGGVAPKDDVDGRPYLELCPVCDTGDVDRRAALAARGLVPTTDGFA